MKNKSKVLNVIIFATSYLFASLLSKPIERQFGISDYNPFSDGFINIKLLISFGIYIFLFLLAYFFLNFIVDQYNNKRSR